MCLILILLKQLYYSLSFLGLRPHQLLAHRFIELEIQLTIAKKMAACRFYRDPLRKVDFICSKTVIRLIF